MSFQVSRPENYKGLALGFHVNRLQNRRALNAFMMSSVFLVLSPSLSLVFGSGLNQMLVKAPAWLSGFSFQQYLQTLPEISRIAEN